MFPYIFTSSNGVCKTILEKVNSTIGLSPLCYLYEFLCSQQQDPFRKKVRFPDAQYVMSVRTYFPKVDATTGSRE